jgi:hypothetical protein
MTLVVPKSQQRKLGFSPWGMRFSGGFQALRDHGKPMLRQLRTLSGDIGVFRE